ncbi:hypothetical protein [Chitinophaga pinensis]|uniref:Uncharacterized protein n=1 Tax=Chitinophaga pinensis (strain ATCC 43595 / DSM 2588 / LMG 13176 / NBRC 15968 / NCIMB 11800 / UQM 2034) TaxID=485918 RepID=A0A979GPZ6_CHIPD|nr:hypothetical protein [Chitinophaga pinensis]ACU57814.1 hypothetical protein Cpin_0315 [Chitinophaga pinensis DSM 2588]
MYHSKVLLLLLVFLVLNACTSKRTPPEHAFYYWKSDYTLIYDRYPSSDPQDSLRRTFGASHVYLHLFDVDWSENLSMPIPKAAFRGIYEVSQFIRDGYTPVVFITNRTFERMLDSSCALLARRVADKINQLSSNIKHTHDSVVPQEKQRPEIQIDCDWTAGTKDKYFHFLKEIRQLFPDYTLSATIRLYPYKYPDKTGIPPVDRGMLMCYNLGNIKDVSTINSIFDVNTLKQYLSGDDYPLPLDIAFPVFGWYAWFRGNEFKGIVHDGPEFIEDTSSFAAIDKQRYRIKTDTVLGENYYRAGDILRMEYPDTATLQTAITLVEEKIPDYKRIAFYHWHQSSIMTYEKVIKTAFAGR